MRVWIVDPINYSGMAYYDAGLAGGLDQAGADVALLGSDEPLVTSMTGHGWQHLPIFAGTGPGRPRWRRAAAYASSIVRLLGLLRRRRPDVVIWNYIEVPVLDVLTVRWARRTGARVAFIAHETEPWEGSGWRRRAHRSMIEDLADLVIVHGPANAAALREAWDAPDERIFVSEHGDYRDWVGTPADQGVARRRLDLPTEVPIALFFGALRRSKGLGTLIDAWPTVRASLPEARLVIAGRPYRGSGDSDLESLPDGTVLRAGSIPPDAADDYYAAADVVAIPYDKVSTSGVLRYAYSAARPVVATDTGELSDHVRDGETGWLVPVGDTAAISAALIEALGDREGSARMGAAARTYATGTFDWGVIGERLHERLTTLAETGP